MMTKRLPLPSHYRPDSVDQVWRVPYQLRAEQARSWAARHSIIDANSDEPRIALLVIDVQNTFCLPEHELFVAGTSGRGAVDDTRRLCEFIYRHLGQLTEIIVTLDTHQSAQIFHPMWLVDPSGQHPDPMTTIRHEEVIAGRWRFNEAISSSLGLAPGAGQAHLEHYTGALAQQGRFELMIWPYHGMLGGIGHALVSAFEEAVFFHSLARNAPYRLIQKGNQALTEHYSAIQPEVLQDPSGAQLGRPNPLFLELLRSNDALIVAGQAKSHCVAWTIQDLIDQTPDEEHNLLRKIYLLEDCTSPVVVPGIADYSSAADAAFAQFAAEGIHIVRSDSPLASWPAWPQKMQHLLVPEG
jgi:nicotinamidase-related amidase